MVTKEKEGSSTAALVCHGVYQYVRLPDGFRFEGDQVTISKYRDGVILKPLAASGSKPSKKAFSRSGKRAVVK